MAPTPATGQAKTPNKPSTPAAKKTPAGPPSTPKTGPKNGPKKLGSTTPNPSQAAGQAKQTPGETAAAKPQQAQQALNDSSASDNDDSDDEPMSKVTQAKDTLQEQAPEPMQSDDEDHDTVDSTKETADDAGDKAKEAGDKAQGQAKQVGDKAQGQAKQVADRTKGQAQQAGDKTGDKANKAKTQTQQATNKAQQATEDDSDDNDDDDEAQPSAGGASQSAKDAAGKLAKAAKDQDPSEAKDAADGAKEQTDDAKDQVDGQVEDAKDGAEDAVEGAKDTAEDATDKAKDAAEDTTDQAQDAAGDAKDKTNEAQDNVDSGTEEAGKKANETIPALPDVSSLPLDLSVLDGLTVNSTDGLIYNHEGTAIGRITEGDAEDLGDDYPISGDKGEILDSDGDLVGRCELLPAEIKRQMNDKPADELPEGAHELLNSLPADHELPDVGVLKGYTCTEHGEIYNDEGDRIGLVEDGDAGELQHLTLNEKGEFVDEEGEVKGHARVDPDAAHLFQGAEHAQDAADGAQEHAQDAVEGAANQAQDATGEAKQGIEDQLPGIEALEGHELNTSGEIVHPDGQTLAHVDDEELKEKLEKGEVKPQDLHIDAEGQVVDAEGNVLGHVSLAEGAAEKLKDDKSIDIRILAGRKPGKTGKVLDDDGEQIGELSSGDAEACRGKKIEEDGSIKDKNGNEIGRASVVPGEAAEAAQKQLLEELGEAEDQGPKMITPDLSIVDGLKVNKNAKVLDEDGEEIAELVDGDKEQCKGKKCNANGEVLDADGNVIGHVKTLEREQTPEEIEAAEHEGQGEHEEEHADAEEAHEESPEGEEHEDNLPPLSTLEGLKCNKTGKLVGDEDIVRGELVEGDAKKLAKLGITCDEEGVFWQQGKQLGKAKTVAQEDHSDEPPFAGLENLIVSKDGFVIVKDTGERVGTVSDGDWKKLIGRSVDEDGDIISKNGTVQGHAERYEEPEPEEAAPIDLSSLEGKTCTKAGFVMSDDGTPLAKVAEGNPKQLSKLKLDGEGQFWDGNKQVGRVELIPEDERETDDGIFAGHEGLHVIADGKVADHEDNIVGQIVEGDAKKLIGMAVDNDGEIVDKFGQVKGKAEPLQEEEPEEIDYSVLDGLTLNKKGLVVDSNGQPVGKLIEGDAAQLNGRKCDEKGFLYNDQGKVVGKCQPLPENERPSKSEGPFAGLSGLHVADKDGSVHDSEGRKVGQVDGDPKAAKKLVGLSVDEDGDILDSNGNSKGHASPWEEEEEEKEDLSPLQGCTINKLGYAVDGNKNIIGKVAEGDVKNLVGKSVGKDGIIFNASGEQVGRAELVHDAPESGDDGPFAGFEGEVKVQKDGTCTLSSSGDIVGRVTDGDHKKLQNRTVEADGSILDSKGNQIGTAERWEPEEKEKNVSPMSGCKVTQDGEIRSRENGELLGRLTSGNLGECVGLPVDDSNNVVDDDGNHRGVATLLQYIEEEEEEVPEEETEEQKQAREDEELAKKMTAITRNTIDQVQPVCKKIKDRMDQADNTPKEELDEEKLVDDVKPMIEEGGRILQECNGSLKGLDPDGKIAARAKGRAGSGEASPAEHTLAENLKELSTNVTGTIDDAKKRLQKYPHAKKKLNPLWGLLSQPLAGVLAAVGLLLTSVVALLGQLLSFGQFNLLRSIVGHFIPDFDGMFSGIKKKAGDALNSLPVIGGLLGGGK